MTESKVSSIFVVSLFPAVIIPATGADTELFFRVTPNTVEGAVNADTTVGPGESHY